MPNYGFGFDLHGQLTSDATVRVVWTPRRIRDGIVTTLGWSYTQYEDGHLLGIAENGQESTASGHSLELKTGRLYARGDNRFGQCGTLHSSAEVAFDKDTRIIKAVTGHLHSAAISDLGDLYVWGSNQFGQLGLGTKSGEETLGETVTVPTFVDFGLDDSQTDVSVFDIACGSRHTLVVTNQGLYGAGSNAWGQLGLGSAVRSSASFTKILDCDPECSVKTGRWHSVLNSSLPLQVNTLLVDSGRAGDANS